MKKHSEIESICRDFSWRGFLERVRVRCLLMDRPSHPQPALSMLSTNNFVAPRCKPFDVMHCNAVHLFHGWVFVMHFFVYMLHFVTGVRVWHVVCHMCKHVSHLFCHICAPVTSGLSHVRTCDMGHLTCCCDILEGYWVWNYRCSWNKYKFNSVKKIIKVRCLFVFFTGNYM